MAEILIQDIEMPQGCGALTLSVWSDGQVEIIDADGEWKTSKAVLVPPHGDLIDRDAARETIKPWSPEDEMSGCTFDTVKKLMHTMLTRAPTIIPAEEGE